MATYNRKPKVDNPVQGTKNEDEIYENDQKLKLVLQASQLGMWEWDMRTNQVFWDERMHHIFGYFDKSFDQQLETFRKHIHPDDLPKLRQAVEEAIAEDKPYHVELRIIWDDQSIHYNIGQGIVLKDQSGAPEKLIGASLDITDIRQKDERMELAVQAISDGIWDWPDMKSNKTWWSPKFYALLGMEDGELEATVENFRELTHPDDRLSPAEIAQHIREDKPIDIELRLCHKTEGYKWFRNQGQVFRDLQGKPVRMAGAIADISQAKEAEFALTHTNEMLRKANEYLDNFVFTVAHDLRSPVANLKSLVELFKTQANAEDPIVSRIDLSVERLEQTLRGLIQILDVQKAESKIAHTLHFQEVLDKLMQEMEYRLAEYKVDIEASFEVGQIRYMEAYLESIMRNLISNAAKYSQEKNTPLIHIATRKSGPYVVLEVTDNGVGIDLSRFKDKIFKPFERLSRKSSGHGIGLHLIKTMVEKNGGKIEVVSKLNEGTTFTIYLKPYA